MKKTIKILAVFAAVAFLGGCKKSDNPVTAGESYDGTWSGTTSQGKRLSFTVSGSAVASTTVGYKIVGASCTVEGSSYTTYSSPTKIAGSTLTVVNSGSDLSYTIQGTFTSGSSASGTVNLAYHSYGGGFSCDGTANASWSAQKKTLVPPTVNLNGKWMGTCSSSLLNTNPITLNLSQSEDWLSGTYTVTGMADGLIDGTVSGNTVDFLLTQTTTGCAGNFVGAATVVGDTMKFTFTGSDCLGSHTNGRGTVVRDTLQPRVVSTDPGDKTTGVPLDAVIRATFNKTMDSTSVKNAFMLEQGVQRISGQVTCSGATATFTPLGGLLKSATYKATISWYARDLAGNLLGTDYSWQFVATAVDTTLPRVISTIPVDGATGVSASTLIKAVFSESMDASTLNTSTCKLKDAGGNTVSVIVSAYTDYALLTPST